MRRILVPGLLMGILVMLLPSEGLAGGGGNCEEPPTDASSAVVELSNICFRPTVTRVDPGTTVTFVNRDGLDHVIAAAGDGWRQRGRMNEIIRPGRMRAVTFDQEGVYPFACYFHPTMIGAVVVGDGEGPWKAAPVIRRIEPPPTPEPAVYHIPKTVTASAVTSPARAAGLVWGGAALGLLGGLIVAWASRRRSL